jgi:hypothetical protein
MVAKLGPSGPRCPKRCPTPGCAKLSMLGRSEGIARADDNRRVDAASHANQEMPFPLEFAGIVYHTARGEVPRTEERLHRLGPRSTSSFESERPRQIIRPSDLTRWPQPAVRCVAPFANHERLARPATPAELVFESRTICFSARTDRFAWLDVPPEAGRRISGEFRPRYNLSLIFHLMYHLAL